MTEKELSIKMSNPHVLVILAPTQDHIIPLLEFHNVLPIMALGMVTSGYLNH